MDPSDFDALSFDCYGTLIDWEAGIAAVLGPWAQSRDLDLTDEALLTAYSGHEARAEAEHPGDLYPLILERSLRDLGAELGVEVTQEDAQRLGRSVPDWPAFGDSHDALTALGERYQLIILSNVDRESFAASNRRLGVTFTSILTAQDIGSYKPAPPNFEALLAEAERLGVATGPATARRPEPVPRSRSGATSGPAHRLDQPPPRPARLGRHPGSSRRCHPGLGVPVHAGLRCGRHRHLTAPPKPPRPADPGHLTAAGPS